MCRCKRERLSMCVCGNVCVCACKRACVQVHACVRECVKGDGREDD